MSIELRVPVLPESVTDGLVSSWHKKEGDFVKRDEILVDIETDKVVFEVPATHDGMLTHILKQEGDTVGSEETLGTIDNQQSASTTSDKPASTPANKETTEIVLTPAVRNLVAEHDLDPAMINGTGKGGRILKADVLQYIEQQQASNTPAESSSPPPPVSTPGTAPAVRREPMSRLRTKIAERMVEVQHNAAILSTFNEVNMQAVMAMRKRYQEAFQKKHGIKLGVMSFFVKAACEALKRFPVVNASVEDNDILYHDYYDVSIAVSSPRGLVVPVIRNADQLGFAGIEQAIADFALRAKEGKLDLNELLGGTFTITNGGVFGSMLSTPLLNPPQSAILGMHNIQQRAVVEDGEIVIRPMMYLALSYDHRIIDGRDAVQFLVNIKQSLEEPHRLLLDI